VRFPPAQIQLRRAQLVLMLAVLVPTVFMTAIGILLLVIGERHGTPLVAGVLVLTFCGSGITGYILVSIFVTKGASLARVQNDFTSAVSHELRTPVTSIRLLIESLKGNRLTDTERDQVLSLLARETDRLEELVGRVLELSRLESGSHVYARERVEIRDVVDEAVAAFDALTLINPTKITTELEPGLVVTGDKATLVRAIANLLTNAWKYSGPEKRISIEARGAGRWVEIVVRDNGIGIEPGEQKSIYEQFKRGRAAVDSGAPGIGLGLAFVRTIVRGHRGKLDLTSHPGETAFRIRLKRRREPERAPTRTLVPS
jgi:two-component system phosphate regulon sensor histidine kinase PhoR